MVRAIQRNIINTISCDADCHFSVVLRPLAPHHRVRIWFCLADFRLSSSNYCKRLPCAVYFSPHPFYVCGHDGTAISLWMRSVLSSPAFCVDESRVFIYSLWRTLGEDNLSSLWLEKKIFCNVLTRYVWRQYHVRCDKERKSRQLRLND